VELLGSAVGCAFSLMMTFIFWVSSVQEKDDNTSGLFLIVGAFFLILFFCLAFFTIKSCVISALVEIDKAVVDDEPYQNTNDV
jgi:hypothetical protein